MVGLRVVDEVVSGIGRDDDQGNPEPVADLVDLRGKDVVVPAAEVVPCEEDSGRAPIPALHHLVDRGDDPVFTYRGVVGGMLTQLLGRRHQPRHIGEEVSVQVHEKLLGREDVLEPAVVLHDRNKVREWVPAVGHVVTPRVPSPGKLLRIYLVDDRPEGEGAEGVRRKSAGGAGDKVEVIREARPHHGGEVVVEKAEAGGVIPVVRYVPAVVVPHRQVRTRGIDETVIRTVVVRSVATAICVADVAREARVVQVKRSHDGLAPLLERQRYRAANAVGAREVTEEIVERVVLLHDNDDVLNRTWRGRRLRRGDWEVQPEKKEQYQRDEFLSTSQA